MLSPDALISVIIPAHNAERFIGETLASVLAQTHAKLEVVVVDDGSTDGTAAIVEALAAADPRVRLFRTAQAGVSAARNLAIAHSHGALIAPIDADDLWRPDKLERQLQAMREAGSEVGVVYTWMVGIDEDGMVVAPSWCRGVATGDVLRAVIETGLIGNASTPLIRRAVLETAGRYSAELRLGEDWELHIRLAAQCPFAVVRDDLVGYRFSAGSATTSAGWRREIDRTTRWVRQTWPDLPAGVLRRRAYYIESFLTFLAVKRGDYLAAIGLRLRGFAVRPQRIFSRDLIDFYGLLIGHMIGLRRYAWRMGPPRAFLDSRSQTMSRQPGPGSPPA